MNSGKTLQPARRSKVGRLYRISYKELVEILRDRRTIITLILMPLIVYPLLGIVVQKLMVQSASTSSVITYKICFENAEVKDELSKLMSLGQFIASKLDREDDNPPNGIAAEIQSQFGSAQQTEFQLAEVESVIESVRIGDFDIGVAKRKDSEGRSRLELYYVPSSKFSNQALQIVGRWLRLADDEQLRRWFETTVGRKLATATFIETAVKSDETGRPAMLTFVPLMLVLMTITGAVYPAIDLTAGERERGTMEILVAAPISRMVLLFGKFVAVLTVAMLTALANLAAMVITIYSLGLDSVIFGQSGVSVWTLLVIFLLLFVLAAFFSATLLGLTSFARSFKEAQAYLIPLMLVAFAPGLLSLTPNLETTSLLAIVPLVNVVMVGRDLLAGTANSTLVVVAVFSTAFYGVLALAVAARIFGADAVLTGDRAAWSSVFDKSQPRSPYPSMTTALFFLAILFPFFIVVSGLSTNLATKLELPIVQRLYANAAITFLSFVLLPLSFTAAFRLMPRPVFFLFSPSAAGCFAALLLGISVWTLAYEIEVVTLTNDRAQELIKFFAALKLDFNEIPLVVKLFCLAIIPAICEEFTFRGFLLSAFRQKMSASGAVVSTAVLFGLFHVFVRDNLFLERLLPSALMGLLLGFVCVRTGSIFPGMILHVLHNGLLITMAHYEAYFQQLGIGIADQKHLPVYWILVALIPIAIGLSLLIFAKSGGRQAFQDRQISVAE